MTHLAYPNASAGVWFVRSEPLNSKFHVMRYEQDRTTTETATTVGNYPEATRIVTALNKRDRYAQDYAGIL